MNQLIKVFSIISNIQAGVLKQVKAKLQDAEAAMGTHNQADSNSEGIRELRIMVCSCNTELEENKKTIIREISNMRLKNKTI